MLTNPMLSHDLIWNNTAMQSFLIIRSDLYCRHLNVFLVCKGLQHCRQRKHSEVTRLLRTLCARKAILDHEGAEEKYPILSRLTNKLASKIINLTFTYQGGMHGWLIIFLLEVWFRGLPPTPPPPCAGGGSVETGRPIDRASTLLPSLSASYF